MVKPTREWLPDSVAAVWVGGILAAPGVAAACSYFLGPPIWVFLVPLLLFILAFCGVRLVSARANLEHPLRQGVRPVRLGWVLTRFGVVTGGAIILAYVVAVIGAAPG